MRFASEYDLTPEMVPAAIIRSKNGERFFLKEDVTIKSIKKFYNDWKHGALTPYKKSQEAIKDPENSLSLNVVGSNYQEMVIDNDHDVLLLFYDPTNRKCQEFLTEWWKCAFYFHYNPNIQLMQIDWSKNEVDGVTVKTIPNMRFYPSGDKNSPVSMLHISTFDAVVNTVKQFTSYPWIEPPEDYLSQEVLQEVHGLKPDSVDDEEVPLEVEGKAGQQGEEEEEEEVVKSDL